MIDPLTLRKLDHSVGQLIHLGLDPAARLCTYGPVDVAGHRWQHANFQVGASVRDEGGISAFQFTLIDPGFAWTKRLRAEDRPGIACQWHLMYQGRTGWESELLFSGYLETPRFVVQGAVEITAVLAGGHVALTPRIPYESPYSLARGETRVINGTTYEII